jgi:hypothetical protein
LGDQAREEKTKENREIVDRHRKGANERMEKNGRYFMIRCPTWWSRYSVIVTGGFNLIFYSPSFLPGVVSF